MRETNLDCCVVRDLLPSYLEELTETETSAMVREHIEHCAACRQLEEDKPSFCDVRIRFRIVHLPSGEV